MNFNNLIKQPWFQIGVGALAVLILLVAIYLIGKSAGRKQAGVEFNTRQAELLKKSQEAVVAADFYKNKAEENEQYAENLQKIIAGDRKTATANETRVNDVYKQSIGELNNKYEKDKAYINSDLSDCQRCADLCQRSNQLLQYGPEFSSAKCDTNTACQAACNP